MKNRKGRDVVVSFTRSHPILCFYFIFVAATTAAINNESFHCCLEKNILFCRCGLVIKVVLFFFKEFILKNMTKP